MQPAVWSHQAADWSIRLARLRQRKMKRWCSGWKQVSQDAGNHARSRNWQRGRVDYTLAVTAFGQTAIDAKVPSPQCSIAPVTPSRRRPRGKEPKATLETTLPAFGNPGNLRVLLANQEVPTHPFRLSTALVLPAEWSYNTVVIKFLEPPKLRGPGWRSRCWRGANCFMPPVRPGSHPTH